MLGTTIVTGTTFGVVAKQSGLLPAEIVAMSTIVFAGAAQFAMVQLLAAGTSVPIVILTVFFINLRHVLMATSLRAELGRLALTWRLPAAFFLTDESFAMAVGYARRGGRSLAYYATFAVTLYVLWNLSTIAGIALGDVIREPRRFGVDFAITATFIGIVVLAVRNRRDVVVALCAAGLAGALALAGASAFAVVAAGATAPLLALPRRG